MKRSLLPLNALRAFDAAARHKSFKRAADELSVTPAAISQQIRSLEDFLGVELFRRSNRNLMLTDAADLALAPLALGFEHLEDAVDRITASKRDHLLRIAVTPSFASKWLVPRLASYYQDRPEAVVKIASSMALTDFKSEQVDLAIRYGAGNYPNLYTEKLLSERVFPVCAPSLLKGGVPLCTESDLTKFTLIHDDSFSEDASAPTWPMWLKAAGITMPDGVAAIHFNTHLLAIEAAVAGQGIALARSSIAGDDLKSGRLVQPFSAEVAIDFAHYIVLPEDHLDNPQVTDFIDWLKAEVSAGEDGASGSGTMAAE